MLGNMVMDAKWLIANAVIHPNSAMAISEDQTYVSFSNNTYYMYAYGSTPDIGSTPNHSSSVYTGDILVVKYRNASSSRDDGTFLLYSSSNNGSTKATGQGDYTKVPLNNGEGWHYIVIDLSEDSMCGGAWGQEDGVYSLNYLRMDDVSMDIAYIVLLDDISKVPAEALQ